MSDFQSDVLVVGGGIAGMSGAITLAKLGFSVTLVEQSENIGGRAADWACMADEQCNKCSCCLIEDDKTLIGQKDNIQILTNAKLKALAGEQGNFTASLIPAKSDFSKFYRNNIKALTNESELKCQAIILATGFTPYDPAESEMLGYGRFSQVKSIKDVDEILVRDALSELISPENKTPKVAFFQCIGSRDKNSGRDYCSQFCCKASVRLMKRMKYLRPQMEITNYYIDLQIMGKEFRKMVGDAKKDFTFVQGVPSHVRGPAPKSEDNRIRVVSANSESGVPEESKFDLVVLAIGVVGSPQNEELSKTFGLDLDEHGFISTSNSNGALQSKRSGIYLAGGVAGPADTQLSTTQALAAASSIAKDLNATIKNIA